MAQVVWQTVKTIDCARVGQEVALLEKRIYPGDMINVAFASYQVRGKCCSHGTQCNTAGCPCCWSGLNPNYDPFAD